MLCSPLRLRLTVTIALYIWIISQNTQSPASRKTLLFIVLVRAAISAAVSLPLLLPCGLEKRPVLQEVISQKSTRTRYASNLLVAKWLKIETAISKLPRFDRRTISGVNRKIIAMKDRNEKETWIHMNIIFYFQIKTIFDSTFNESLKWEAPFEKR